MLDLSLYQRTNLALPGFWRLILRNLVSTLRLSFLQTLWSQLEYLGLRSWIHSNCLLLLSCWALLGALWSLWSRYLSLLVLACEFQVLCSQTRVVRSSNSASMSLVFGCWTTILGRIQSWLSLGLPEHFKFLWEDFTIHFELRFTSLVILFHWILACWVAAGWNLYPPLPSWLELTARERWQAWASPSSRFRPWVRIWRPVALTFRLCIFVQDHHNFAFTLWLYLVILLSSCPFLLAILLTTSVLSPTLPFERR